MTNEIMIMASFLQDKCNLNMALLNCVSGVIGDCIKIGQLAALPTELPGVSASIGWDEGSREDKRIELDIYGTIEEAELRLKETYG